MKHEMITTIEDTPKLKFHDIILRIHNDVVETGNGYIETETETLEVCMNLRNASKLAVMMTQDSMIGILKSGRYGIIRNNFSTESDDTIVFCTTSEREI